MRNVTLIECRGESQSMNKKKKFMEDVIKFGEKKNWLN